MITLSVREKILIAAFVGLAIGAGGMYCALDKRYSTLNMHVDAIEKLYRTDGVSAQPQARLVVENASSSIVVSQQEAQAPMQQLLEPVIEKSTGENPSVAPSPTVPTSPSLQPPKPKESPSLVDLATYTHPSYDFSFQYPQTWNKIENTPPDPDSLSFSRYPQNSESLEMHITVGEKLNMEQVVSSDAVEHKVETIVVAEASVQKLTFEQFDRHGGSTGFMREIHIAVPLPSGKFLNLLGVCSTVGSSYDGRCTATIDDIMNTIVIPSVKVW